MTIVTIDYNNDEIRVADERDEANGRSTVIAKGPWCVTNQTAALLYEVINAVVGNRGVRLEEISEDVRSTKEEW